jgi:UDPglucose--hexose-1-phosphate uridylyltransferase
MNELRRDELTGRSVLVAENRAHRPFDVGHPGAVVTGQYDPNCPFCAGNEHITPHEIDTLPSESNWQVRVVPNKYPAVAPEAPHAGIHEVLVESPRHLARLGELSLGEVTGVLTMYGRRLRYWRQQGCYPYQLLFKNCGGAGGASLQHVHSQLVALAAIPPLIVRERTAAERYFTVHGGCITCDAIERELAEQKRIVWQSAELVALCPQVSRQALETWIMPRNHSATFDEWLESPAALAELAGRLLHTLREIEHRTVETGYNLMLFTLGGSALGDAAANPAAHHWRVEIVPRLASFAGFELATGLYLNAISPERAAAELRAALESA